jgi:alcohol dehydrogenase class IV
LPTSSLAFPRIVRIGGGASDEVPEVLKQLGFSRPALLTGKHVHGSGMVQPLLDRLATAGIAVRVCTETVPDPTVAAVEACAAFLRQGDHDCLIAFGGGSVLDTAKIAALVFRQGGATRDYKAPRLVDEPGLPVIAIPTTAGTGSEVSRFATAADQLTDEKMLFMGLGFLPVAALVDHELTVSKPPRLTADTGLDALTHAIESYVSARATPFTRGQALMALRAIGPNLRAAYREPGNAAAREAMMLGATYAGLAFSNSSVALVHALSRQLSALFHMSHGLSNAMLLPTVTEYSAPAAPALYAQCARAMALAAEADDDGVAVVRLLAELRSLNADLDVPSPKAFGVPEARFEEALVPMAERALASGTPGVNPRVPNVEEIVAIYRRAWNA